MLQDIINIKSEIIYLSFLNTQINIELCNTNRFVFSDKYLRKSGEKIVRVEF